MITCTGISLQVSRTECRLQKTQMFLFFFFNDTATTEIYTLSLHDALPICALRLSGQADPSGSCVVSETWAGEARHRDRKSTRLNSSHLVISYAVFCLKKKKKEYIQACIDAVLCHSYARPWRLRRSAPHSPL